MSEATTTPGQGSGRPAGGRTLPIAAIAGALVLVGLVGIALYRRATGVSGPAAAAPPAEAASDAAGATDADSGATIAVTAPVRLTPEATILAERYRCVCGCNDPLPVCTCRNPDGSEEMKQYLLDLAKQGLPPEDVDRQMTGRFGEAALLSHPAPKQTQPSHAGSAAPPD
jgi:hypothetical protein